jgi:O-antigen ligase/tetratricopeptide (TPR) repeat protein
MAGIIATIRTNESRLQLLARWLVYALLVIPLVVGNHYFFPFIVPKYLLFRVLVEVLVLVYLLLLLANPQRYRLRWHWASFAILGYSASAIISGALGIDWRTSFYGTFERMEGIFTTIHYVALFLVLPSLFTREEWIKILKWSVGVSVLLSLYGLVQKFNLFPSARWMVESGRDRISATIGNPSYVAAYLLFQIGFAAYLWLREKAKGWRLLWTGVLVLQFIVLILTLTRGAMLGLLVALPATALVWLWLTRRRVEPQPILILKLVRRWVSMALIAVVVLPVALVLLRDTSIIKSVPILQRFADVSPNSTTAKTRFMTWNSAWQGIKERPIIGWGSEQFPVPFNKYIDARHYRGPNSETWFDHAHDIILDILVTQGSLGLLTWLVFIGGLLVAALKLARSKNTMTVGLVGFGILVAYIVQNLFLFDVLVVWMMLALVGGLLIGRRSEDEAESKPMSTKWIGLILVVYVLALVGWALPENIRTNHVNRQVINIRQGDNSKEAIQAQLELFEQKVFNKSVTTGYYELPRQLNSIVLYHYQQGHFTTDKERNEAMDYAIAKMREVNERYPYDLQTSLALAKTIAMQGEANKQQEKIEESIALLRKAQAYSPDRVELIYDIGLYQMALGRSDEALATYQRMVELIPNVPFAHWSYGFSLLRAGQMAEAKVEMEGALSDVDFYAYVYGNGGLIQRLVDLYVNLQDWGKLAETYRYVLTLSPDSAATWGSLALTYQKLGDYQNGIAAAQEAARLEPQFKEAADQLIKELQAAERKVKR